MMESVSGFEFLLLAIAALIPVVGFVMTLSHARKGNLRREQRWRKNHGILFWVFLPGIAGMLTVLGTIELLPRVFAVIGIIMLSLTTFASWWLQRRHEERNPEL